MKKIINLLSLVLILALLFFFYRTFFEITWRVFYKQDSSFMDTGLAAFWGAIISFLILMTDRFLGAMQERRKKNRIALGKIQLFLGEYLITSENNLVGLKNLRASLVDPKPSLAAFNLRQVFTDQSLCLDLTNDDFLNDYFKFTIRANTVNGDFELVTKEYSKLKDLLLSKTISFVEFKNNLTWLIPQLDELIGHLEKIDEFLFELVDKVAAIRKCSEDSVSIFIRFFVINSKYPENFQEMVRIEKSNRLSRSSPPSM